MKGKHKLTIPGHTGPVKAVAWVAIIDSMATFVRSVVLLFCFVVVSSFDIQLVTMDTGMSKANIRGLCVVLQEIKKTHQSC